MAERLGARSKRLALFAVGCLFTALGMIGAVLPVMPTTPFLLVALWAFANSSRRFHDWLYHHRLFGPTLQAWDRHRVIPLKAKVMAISAMVASMVYVVGFSQAPWYLLAVMGVSCSSGAAFIFFCPSRPPAGD